MKILRNDTTYHSLLGLSLGVGLANWAATGPDAVWLIVVLWAGASLLGGGLAYLLSTRIHQTATPPATLAAAGLPVTGLILSLVVGVPPLLLALYGLGGIALGLLLGLLLGMNRTLRPVAPVLALLFVGASTLLWLNGQLTVLGLWHMVAALAFPIIGLALYSQRPHDIGALFTLAILLLVLGVIVGLFLHQMETGQLRVPDLNAIVLVVASAALAGLLFVGLANSSRVWLRPTLNMALFVERLAGLGDHPDPKHLRALDTLYAGLPRRWRQETLESRLDHLPSAAWESLIMSGEGTLAREAADILEKCLRSYSSPHEDLAAEVFASLARQPEPTVWQPAFGLLIRHHPSSASQIARTTAASGSLDHAAHYLAQTGWKTEAMVDLVVDALFRTPAEQARAMALLEPHARSLNASQRLQFTAQVAHKFTPANLEKLLPLLDDSAETIRAFTRELLRQGHASNTGLQASVIRLLSQSFRTLATGAGDSLALLSNLNHAAAVEELTWAQAEAGAIRARALARLAEVLPIETAGTLKTLIQAEGNAVVTDLLTQPSPDLQALVLRQIVPEPYRPHQESGWLERATLLLSTGYGLPAREARQITQAASQVLCDQYFSFVMRQEQAPKDTFHLEEMISEPDDLITASHITTWFYETGGQIKDVVIAGHANAAVCKAATAKVMNAILDLPENVIETALVVTGAGLIRVTQDIRKPDNAQPQRPAARASGPQTSPAMLQALFKMQLDPPLRDLRNELQGLHGLTGLVTTQTVQRRTYSAIYDDLRTRILEAAAGEPCVLQRTEPEAASPLLMPYFQLNDRQAHPLTFTLTEAVLQPDRFRELLQVHQHQLQQEMVRDAERRKKVYQEWRERDEEALQQLTRQMVKAVLPNAGQSTIFEIAGQYIAVLMKDPLPELPVWEFGAQWADRELSYQTRLQRFYNFVRTHARRQPVAALEAVSAEIQVATLPVSGVRVYADATVQPGENTTYVSVQEIVEWRLPFGMHRTDEWIERMNKLLLKFDPKHPDYEGNRLDAINLGVFLDAFLRGWPPVFIQDPRARELYNQWSVGAREGAWRHIHDQLRQRQIHMLPLQSENVVFSVRETSPGSYELTPYFLAESRQFTIVVNPSLGIPYYVNLWQHRQLITAPTTDNRASAQAATETGIAHLEQGRPAEAATSFKAALRAHAALAAESIFIQAYTRTTREDQARTQRLAELTETMGLYATATGEATHKLRQFSERYPHFLPDPYLLIAYFEAEQADTPATQAIQKLQAQVETVTLEIDELIETLVDEQILIPEPASSGNVRYRFNSTQEEAAIHIIQQQIESGEPLPEDHRMAARQILRWRGGLFDGGASLDDDVWSVLGTAGAGSGLQDYMHLLQPTAAQDVDQMDDQALYAAFLRLPNRLRTLNQLQKHREALEETLRNKRSLIWEALEANRPDQLRQALALDRAYVTRVMQTRTHLGIHSNVYLGHVAPLGELKMANEAFRVQADLARIIRDQDWDLYEALKTESDKGQRLALVRDTAEQILALKEGAMLPAHHLHKLADLHDYLSTVSEIDTLTQGDIRHVVDSTLEYYLDQAYRNYQMIAKVGEAPEVRRQLSHCERMRGSYRAAIQRVAAEAEAPLMVAYPDTRFTLENTDQTVPANAVMRLDTAAQAIQLEKPRETITLLTYDRLRPDEAATLNAAFSHDTFANTLKAQQTSAAYSLLLAPVPVSPLITAWRQALKTLEPWLIRAIAYAGISTGAIDERYRDDVLAVFDAKPIVTGIQIDQTAIVSQILAGLDMEDAPTQTV